MNHYDIADKFARMWRASREAAGRSQDYMAKTLGVSKKTIQNWEDGTSSPSQMKGFEWFQALDIQPMPYYLSLLSDGDFPGANDYMMTREVLVKLILNFPPDVVDKLIFLLSGKHGSSPAAVIEMVTAHLHCELRTRLNVAQSIITNYEIAEVKGTMVEPEKIRPNMDLLKGALDAGIRSVVEGKDTYSVMEAFNNEKGGTLC